MTEEYNVGDVIRLTNTQQEGEVLEVIHVGSDEHRGPLLRVNLLDVKPPMIVYYSMRSVQLVRPAAPDQAKKPERTDKAEPGKKAEPAKAEPEHKAEHGKAEPHTRDKR